MNNQHRLDPRFPGNMVPPQPGSPDHHDPRSQQRIIGRPGAMNIQQAPSSPQSFDASSWVNSAYAAQYYGYTQPAPQDPYSNNASFMGSHQTMQSYSPVSFGGSFGDPGYQSQFDPRAQMLQNWTVAQSAYGPGMQFTGQRMPYQHTAAQQSQMRPQTDIKQDPETIDRYSGNYDDSRNLYSGDYDDRGDAYSGEYAADDDPSVQLMQELVQNILDSKTVSPTSGASESKQEDVSQGSSNSTVDATESPSNNSVLYTPQNAQSVEHQTFRSFEFENSISETEQSHQNGLHQQVDQVLAGLNDEDMQDAILEEQTSIEHT